MEMGKGGVKNLKIPSKACRLCNIAFQGKCKSGVLSITGKSVSSKANSRCFTTGKGKFIITSNLSNQVFLKKYFKIDEICKSI